MSEVFANNDSWRDAYNESATFSSTSTPRAARTESMAVGGVAPVANANEERFPTGRDQTPRRDSHDS
jgi:hypothetical protein